MMKMKKAALVAAVSLATVFGATQANAYVYARSYLKVTDLQLGAVDVDSESGDLSPANVTIRSYQNDITNTSGLNGVQGVQTGDGCIYSNCTDTTATALPLLDSEASQLGSSYANNSFAFKGPSDAGDEFARGDSVVHDAAVISIKYGADPATAKTSVEQIAESQLLTGSEAKSGATIQSTTGLTIKFTTSEESAFAINFNAAWDQLAQINTAAFGTADAASAQSEINLFATLKRDGTGDEVKWAPDGSFVDCQTSFGVCSVTKPAGADLQHQVLTTSELGSDANIGSGAFIFFVDELASGDWTLVLNTTTTTLISQTIPVPGTLAIFGLGLVSMGVVSRRRRGVQLAS